MLPPFKMYLEQITWTVENIVFSNERKCMSLICQCVTPKIIQTNIFSNGNFSIMYC